MNTQRTPIKRALLSVSDKTQLLALANALHTQGVMLIATGGTAKVLQEAQLPIKLVSTLTGFPEIMEGRVKTLHPKIHGGLLGKRDLHAEEAAAHQISWIDLLVCNLYPFVSTIAQDPTLEVAVEQIDVGGPTMIRAAAKNFAWVTTVIDPADYPKLLSELDAGGVPFALRKQLAAKAFAHLSHYDAHIAQYLNEADFPEQLTQPLTRHTSLRYGENPHQKAAWYITQNNPFTPPLQGKTLSFNNIADASAALTCVSDFSTPTAVVVKHATLCGIASADTIDHAFQRAWHADSQSAFGGIVALNRPCTADIAAFLTQAFIEVLIAPDFSEPVLALLKQKPNYRVLKIHPFPPQLPRFVYKPVLGGLLVQDRDTQQLDPNTVTVPTQQKPRSAQWADIRFAWQVLKHIKSNAILIAKEETTLGVGGGQVSRVDAVTLAIQKAGPLPADCVLASDGFFPFADSIAHIANTPIKVIVQPGGSIRDAEVIAACDAHGIAMVFTGSRCFTH